MKILVINTGSSSIKYELFDMSHENVLARGVAEKISEKTSSLTHRSVKGDLVETKPIPDHETGLKRIVELLVDPKLGVIGDKSEITAVGHRVVHGGEAFHSTVIIDQNVINAIRETIPLAPLHNPPNLMGIEVAMAVFPDAIQVAVFDTAFHQTIPPEAFLYALPYQLYEKHRVRRYGFHGTSHSYVAEEASRYLSIPLEKLNLITIHLGNGASMAAIKNGKSVDTSMGMTPLEGLVMGTRSGDVDPALPFYLANHLGMSMEQIDRLLNEQSGLKGLCGTNDMREVIEKQNKGDKLASIALNLYCYRIKKYIGAYYAILGKVDAIIFTAGIGEKSAVIRELCCKGLENLGISIDKRKNEAEITSAFDISSQSSQIKVLVIPTNEEFKIAKETQRTVLASAPGYNIPSQAT